MAEYDFHPNKNHNDAVTQRKGAAVLQDNRPQVTQARASIDTRAAQLQQNPSPTNNSGLPATLKTGIESLSGVSMDQVKVHYNSGKPAQLNAHAYAQGSEIHLAPGQEKHLPHEAWHVAQQAQGRVKPTVQMKTGVSINDDTGLEAEADIMGARAASLQMKNSTQAASVFKSAVVSNTPSSVLTAGSNSSAVQLAGGKGKNKGKGKGVKEAAPKPKDHDSLFAAALKSAFSTVAGDAAVTNVGAGGGGLGPFITPGTNGTRHHIFPKSQLIAPALSLSKGLKSVDTALANVDRATANAVQSKIRSVRSLAQAIGINADGGTGGMANYYWNTGIFFFGVASALRTDDPGSTPEPFKPRSLNSEKFQAPKDFGASMVAAKTSLDKIGQTGELDTEKFSDSRKKFATMHASGAMTTSQAKGGDWTLSPRPSSALEYDRKWETSQKIYALNRTATNDYLKYQGGLVASMRKVMAANGTTLAQNMALLTPLNQAEAPAEFAGATHEFALASAPGLKSGKDYIQHLRAISKNLREARGKLSSPAEQAVVDTVLLAIDQIIVGFTANQAIAIELALES